MRRATLTLLSAFSVFLLTAHCPAASVKLPDKATGDVGAFVKVKADSGGNPVRWYPLDPGLNVFPVELLKDSSTAVVTSNTAGSYRLLAYTADKDGPSDPAVCMVVIGTPAPGPVPPGPVPPGPTPNPDPFSDPANPFGTEAAGLRVLILYDTNNTKLPAAQQQILYSATIRSYLNTNCVLGPDGKTREWRMWDASDDASGEAVPWQNAMKKPHTSLPWLFVGNGKTGYSGPLPADVDSTLALLKKYAP